MTTTIEPAEQATKAAPEEELPPPPADEEDIPVPPGAPGRCCARCSARTGPGSPSRWR